VKTTPSAPTHNYSGKLEARVAKYWNQLLAPFMVADTGKALFQLLTTGALYLLGWYLMYRSLEVSYWLTLLLAVPTSGMLVRLFIFQHDCGHGSFFPSPRANSATGFAIGVLMLTPYKYWQRTHAIHHSTSGNLDRRSFGNIRTLTVSEYRQRTPAKRLAYRLYRNLFVLLAVGPAYQFLIKHRLPIDIPLTWKREWRSVMWTNIVIAILVILLWYLIGLGNLLLVQLPIIMMAGSAGMWLFYVQHQFEDTYWERHESWDFHQAGIEGSSFYDLPTLLHWFTGNIGYHHIHHLASRIPNYKLRECFRKIPELHKVTRLSIWRSLKCARLKLWDEKTGKLVGFRHLRSLRADAA